MGKRAGEGWAVGDSGPGTGTGTSSTRREKSGPSFTTTPALHVFGISNVTPFSPLLAIFSSTIYWNKQKLIIQLELNFEIYARMEVITGICV